MRVGRAWVLVREVGSVRGVGCEWEWPMIGWFVGVLGVFLGWLLRWWVVMLWVCGNGG